MDKTLGDLAGKLGIPPDAMRKWTLLIERAETIAPGTVPQPGGADS